MISSIQQYMKMGTIRDVQHVSSSDQLADILTKKGVSSEKIIRAISKGVLEPPIIKKSKWRKSGLYEKDQQKNKVEEIC